MDVNTFLQKKKPDPRKGPAWLITYLYSLKREGFNPSLKDYYISFHDCRFSLWIFTAKAAFFSLSHCCVPITSHVSAVMKYAAPP